MRIRTIALTSSALLTALLLAGCAQTDDTGGMPGMDHGTSPMTPSQTAGDVNPADEMFLTMMIPHHEQAIEMADLVLGKDNVDPRVIELAQQITDAQGPEIEAMKSWLDGWGMPYDDSGAPGGMEGMDHGDGMMSEDDLAALGSASGPDASRLFLEGMILHHEGAVDMARTVLDNGKNAEVAELAQQIIDGQAAEIATMQALLSEL